MPTYGLTVDGFLPKELLTIQGELETSFRAAFGDSIDVSASSVFGQIIGIFAEREALLWELSAQIYAAFDPDQAAGAALDGVAAITGTFRDAASKSAVVETCTGTPSTVLAAGRVVEVPTTSIKFESVSPATILAAAIWTLSTFYGAGARVTNGGNVYHCLIAGTSAPSGGPTGTGLAIVDGTVTWRYLGAGTGVVDVPFEAQENGPKVALSGTLTQIDTPVAGWQNAVNLLDADEGADEESDVDLRFRRLNELNAQGTSTLEAIRSQLLKLDGVEQVVVLENTTLATDINGLPPKSVEPIVKGGTDEDIFAAVFLSVGAGIESFGNQDAIVTDSQSIEHDVSFSRPVLKDIWVTINLIKDPAVYPLDGDTQVKAAVVAFGDTFPMGKDVVASACGAQAFKVQGVLDVTATFIGLAPAPGTSVTIVNGVRDQAVFDTSRVVVNAIDGTP